LPAAKPQVLLQPLWKRQNLPRFRAGANRQSFVMSPTEKNPCAMDQAMAATLAVLPFSV
jgi:hypothetical protein